MKILVTGGAGFIGSHLVDELIQKGYRVRILDNLSPQVHKNQKPPEYLNKKAEFIKGDIRDQNILWEVMKDIDVIFHFAASVGVGQSMYKIRDYMEVNVIGTANILQLILDHEKDLKKLIVASSMSIYGEGAYSCKNCGKVYPKERSLKQLKEKKWELFCPNCGEILKPIPTPEDKPLYPASIYAISKRDQEEMVLTFGKAYKIPTVALRFFNVYGSRQALSNPYTGVAAIFSSRLLNHNPPIIFEDGLQSRDFIHVKDIVRACILALESDKANYNVFNVGTGKPITILKIAEILKDALKIDIKPKIENKFRSGDIRHCFSDNKKIEDLLNFKISVSFEDGIIDLINWIKDQKPEDLVEKAKMELEEKGLTI